MDMNTELTVTDYPDVGGVQLTLRHSGTGFVCGAVRIPYDLIPYLQERLNGILHPAGTERPTDGG